MLINAERQPADQDAGDLCDPTQYAPRDRKPYWNEDIASFSAAVWLSTGTADRGAAINRPHGWSSKTAAHSWFSTNRIAAPNPDLPRLYSPAAVQDTATHATTGASKQQARRIQIYPDSAQKVTITTWLTASRWTYNLTVEILQSGILGRMETHRRYGDAGAEGVEAGMGVGTVPGEAHGGAGRRPGDEQRQDLQPAVGSGSSQIANGRTNHSHNCGSVTTGTPVSHATYRVTRSRSTASITPFWDHCGWLRSFRRGNRNPDWCRSAASIG